jgi:Spy/CpxP family protein refolding chaperone
MSRKLAAAAVVVLSLGALAACKPHGGHDPAKLEAHLNDSLKKVGASEEQQQKIGVISDRIIADGSEICKNNQGLGKKVVGCLLLDQPNKTWLHQTVDAKSRELTAFAHRTIDSLIEISAQLTPQQRKDLKERCEKAHAAH